MREHYLHSPAPEPTEPQDNAPVSVVIASLLREDGIAGVQSYLKRLRQCLVDASVPTTLITPFSRNRPLALPVFAFRLILQPFSRPAGVMWHRHWHEAFLYRALRRHLASAGACVVYAQDPLAARAALRARRGPHQRVVMVVHFRTSQADEWVKAGQIRRGKMVFRAIRQVEREVIPRLDALVYVSQWARRALLEWLPDAANVPSKVIGGIVPPSPDNPIPESLGDLVTVGTLDLNKNHRFLLAVLAEAKRAGRALTLDVFGEGPLRNDLLRLSRSLGVEQQVRFRGFQPGVRKFLPGYRAYVHASHSESFCLAIAEAMAARLPVVVGNVGPIPELCEDGVEARLWPLDDAVKAAAMLINLLDSEPDRLRMAKAARERFDRQLSAEVIVPRLLSFLRVSPEVTRCGQRT